MAYPGLLPAPRLDIDAGFRGLGKVVDGSHHFKPNSGMKRALSAPSRPTSDMFRPATPRAPAAKKDPSTIIPDGSRESASRPAKRVIPQHQTSIVGNPPPAAPHGLRRSATPTGRVSEVALALGHIRSAAPSPQLGLPPKAVKTSRIVSPHRNRESILFPHDGPAAGVSSRDSSPSARPATAPAPTAAKTFVPFVPSTDKDLTSRYKTWKDVKNMVRYKDTPKRLTETESAVVKPTLRLTAHPAATLAGSSLRPPPPPKPTGYRVIPPWNAAS